MTGYQVYLPSFLDSDGDGWGDLRGVTERLDHLADLGIGVIWLTPFFVSPMADHGYDIADHLRIDPRYGDDAALDALLDGAHRRGMRVIADLVVNHTSDRHPWFQSSRTGRGDPHREYYVWRDPAPDGGPPNNWLSHFGGPAWTLDATTGQYYLHLFSPRQPDLNWRSAAVADEIDAVLHHWLSRGVDGFRIDTAAYLLKHPDLPDNPLLPEGDLSPVQGVTDQWRRQDHVHDIHQPDVHDIHRRWRRIADEYGAFLVGEVYELDPERLARYVTAERLHSSFWFGLVESGWDPARFQTMIEAAAASSPRLSWVQGNHDRRRAATRYGGGDLGRRRSLALHTLIALLPGTLWLYQGEELGMEDSPVPAHLVTDPLGRAQPGRSRDVVRTPMPWSSSAPGSGFTSGTPWLPVTVPAQGTVEDQRRDPGSHLNAVRRLLRVRADLLAGDTPAELDWSVTGREVAGYRRGAVTVVANLGDRPARLPAGIGGTVVYDTAASEPGALPADLEPQQALILRG